MKSLESVWEDVMCGSMNNLDINKPKCYIYSHTNNKIYLNKSGCGFTKSLLKKNSILAERQ